MSTETEALILHLEGHLKYRTIPCPYPLKKKMEHSEVDYADQIEQFRLLVESHRMHPQVKYFHSVCEKMKSMFHFYIPVILSIKPNSRLHRIDSILTKLNEESLDDDNETSKVLADNLIQY